MWASSTSSHESSLFVLDFYLTAKSVIRCHHDNTSTYQKKINATALLVQCLSWKQMQD